MSGKLGRKPRIPGRPALRLSTILKAVPDHPLAVDYGQKLTGWGMRLNNNYGTCMAATVANSRYLTTSWLTDNPVNWTDDQVAEFYKTQNPDFPNEDNGMVMQVALEEAHKNGVPDGSKAVAFAELDPRNREEIDAAIAIFGGIMWGVVVTAANMDQFDRSQDWDYVRRSTPEGGHAIEGVGYDDGEKFITWATETEFTQAFEQNQVEEAWIVIWPENLGTRQFQQGIDLQALAAAYKALTDKDLPLPDPPTPAPAPTPDPGAAPFPGCPPRLAQRLVRNAARHRPNPMTPLQYAIWLLEGDLDMRDIDDVDDDLPDAYE